MNTENSVSEPVEAMPNLAAAYPELEKLKAANEALREKGKEWLFATIEAICDGINQQQQIAPSETAQTELTLQVGAQDWQFEIENNIMVGERLGIRHKGQTLLVEIGWPRLPEHGIVPDLGLARARISFSQNIMVDAKLLEEFSLRRSKDADEVSWHLIAEHQIGGKVTADQLSTHVQRVLNE